MVQRWRNIVGNRVRTIKLNGVTIAAYLWCYDNLTVYISKSNWDDLTSTAWFKYFNATLAFIFATSSARCQRWIAVQTGLAVCIGNTVFQVIITVHHVLIKQTPMALCKQCVACLVLKFWMQYRGHMVVLRFRLRCISNGYPCLKKRTLMKVNNIYFVILNIRKHGMYIQISEQKISDFNQ